MTDRINLVDDGFVNFRVRMTHAHGQHAAETIEVLVALLIPNVRAFAFHQRQRLLVISCDGGKKKLFMFANRFG